MNRRGFLRLSAAAPALAAIVSKAEVKPIEVERPVIEPVSDISNVQWLNYSFTTTVSDSIFIPQPDEYFKRFKALK